MSRNTHVFAILQKRFTNRWHHFRIATPAVAVLVLASASGTVAAHADPFQREDRPVILTIENGLVVTDADGGAIVTKSDHDAGGERTITGVLADGTPVRIVVQSAVPAPIEPPTPPDPSASAEYTSSPEGSIESLSYTDDELRFDETLLEPVFAWAVTPTTSSLAWVPSPGITTSEVIREGELLASTNDESFSVGGLTEDTSYVFEVKGSGLPGGQGSPTPSAERTIPITTLSSTEAGDSGSIRSYQPYTTAFQYKTFIQDAWVNPDLLATVGCGLFGRDGYQFKGDGRPFANPGPAAPTSPSDYRSMMFVNVNWDNPSPYDLITTKGIGSTHLYRNGVLQETRTASMRNMLFQDMLMSGAYAQVRFNHSAGNPFCAAGAITYNVVVRIYRSGTIEVVGNRYPVPNHEGWGRFSDAGGNETWHPVFLLGNQGFGCLTGACGYKSINYSKSV